MEVSEIFSMLFQLKLRKNWKKISPVWKNVINLKNRSICVEWKGYRERDEIANPNIMSSESQRVGAVVQCIARRMRFAACSGSVDAMRCIIHFYPKREPPLTRYRAPEGSDTLWTTSPRSHRRASNPYPSVTCQLQLVCR